MAEIHRVGDRQFGIFRHPRRTSRDILGNDAPPGHDGIGMCIEEFDIRPDKPRIDTFVVVDEGHVGRRSFRDPPVAGIRNPRARFGHHAQVERRIPCREGCEPGRRIVRRIVVHHHAFPLPGGHVLPHDGFERREKLSGTIMRWDYEREADHRANVAIYP